MVTCPCECNSGGFCGGCGHVGCSGGINIPRRSPFIGLPRTRRVAIIQFQDGRYLKWSPEGGHLASTEDPLEAREFASVAEAQNWLSRQSSPIPSPAIHERNRA